MTNKKILSSDILIADVIIPVKTQTEIDQLEDPTLKAKYQRLNNLLDGDGENKGLLAQKKVKRGQKLALTKPEFDEVSKAVAGLPINGIEPGGSSANTLTTLCKLLPDHVKVDFLGAVGSGMYSQIIRNGLEQAKNINLIPHPDELPGAESALSFVFRSSDGSRTIATYPGNAKALLKPEMVTQDMIADNDVVFIQGSLWEKFDKGIVDKIVHERWQQDKEIWLALPTHAKFSDNMPPATYRYFLNSADVVLGNNEELMRIYETSTLDDAIKKLQAALAERDDIKMREGKIIHEPLFVEKRNRYRKDQAVAFITCGEDGAYAVTRDKVEKVPAVHQGPIVNTLGAGDASFAGFLAGHIAGLLPKASAALGMEVASAKLDFNCARLPDPLMAMRHGSMTAKALWRNAEGLLDQPLHEQNGKLAYVHI